MTVFAPDVPEDEIQIMIERIGGYVTAAGGSVTDFSRDSPWGRRRLAYAVRHGSRDVRDGFFTLFHLLVEPHRVEEIERDIKLNDRIMRYLVTSYTPVAAAPEAPAGDQPASDQPAGDAAVSEATPSAEAEPAAAAVAETPAEEPAPETSVESPAPAADDPAAETATSDTPDSTEEA